MFSKTKLAELLALYKEYFNKDFLVKSQNKQANHLGNDTWPGERYKWVAVKHFQDHWDEYADDFEAMLKESLKETFNLLDRSGGMELAQKGVCKLAKAAPEPTRDLFTNLYDESQDLYERWQDFQGKFDVLAKNHINNNDSALKQSNHAVSIYLAFKYPEKYFIYTQKHFTALLKYLECKETFSTLRSLSAFNFFNEFYNQVRRILKLDKDLPQIMKENFDDEMYQDPELTIVTSDLAYFSMAYEPMITQSK